MSIGCLFQLTILLNCFLCASNLPVQRTSDKEPLKRNYLTDISSQLHGMQGEVKKLAKNMEERVVDYILTHESNTSFGDIRDNNDVTEADINEGVDVARYLFSGDIRMSGDEMEELKSSFNGRKTTQDAITEDFKPWPGGVLPYAYDDSFSDEGKEVVQGAMDEVSNKTCVKFKPRTNEKDYVEFFHGRGCWSWAGNQGEGMQLISLQKGGCVHKGIAVHEIMHALGYEHEHTRPDRDKYIDIVWDNIRPGNRIQFDILNSNKFGGKVYDYDSIMHYSDKAFAVDHKKKTIIVKKKNAVIGQRKRLSEIDISSLNNLYCNCTNKVEKRTRS